MEDNKKERTLQEFLEIVKAMPGVSNTYGWYAEEMIDDNTLVVYSKRCPMIAFNEMNHLPFRPDAQCQCHENTYNCVCSRIDPTIGFKFTTSIGRGDDCCRWTFSKFKKKEAPEFKEENIMGEVQQLK